MAKFTVDTETGLYHSISIQSGSFLGPQVDLTLSAQDAYALLQALQSKQDEILDMASHYYDCKECGYTHRNGESCAMGDD